MIARIARRLPFLPGTGMRRWTMPRIVQPCPGDRAACAWTAPRSGVVEGAQGIAADQRGTSVIEFGLFAPVLGLMLMGITDLSMGYSRKLELEQAAYRALEKIQIGYSTARYATLQAEGAAAAGVPASSVVVTQWLECDRARQTSFIGTCPGGQETARYVGLTINGSYTPRFDYGVMTTTAGVVPISAFKSVRIQ